MTGTIGDRDANLVRTMNMNDRELVWGVQGFGLSEKDLVGYTGSHGGRTRNLGLIESKRDVVERMYRLELLRRTISKGAR